MVLRLVNLKSVLNLATVLLLRVGHKRGHYTGDKFMHTANTRNNSVYFLILKFHYKVADVMIKPCYYNGLDLWGMHTITAC